jgi:hypothetical protein
MSQSVLISTFFSRAKPRVSAWPCPRMPMVASTTRSLAPATRLPASGAADAVAAADEPAADGEGRGGDTEPRREVAA